MSAVEDELSNLIDRLNKQYPPPKFDVPPEPKDPQPIVINGSLAIDYNGDVRTGRQVIAAVQFVTGTPSQAFTKHNRWKSFVEARQIAYWFMHHFTALSYPQIGQMIGGRDHSTIMYGVKKIDANPDYFRARMEAVAKVLRIELPEEIHRTTDNLLVSHG